MKELWPGWETVEAIGAGGFAQVYKIRKKDTGDGREYCSALKIITIPQSPSEYDAYLGEGYDDATITAIFTNQVKRIEDEFHMMSQFKGNSNIVSYEDHMIVPHEDGKGWDILIRMELLTSLTTYCGSKAMTEEDTVNLGIGICHALELCQKKSIIHRDIKPQNIFVNEFGDYKLGDFGIAKSMDHTTHATKTGTYAFMAPEVYRGESYGSTVDIYSLGLVLYWLLNERRMPFLPLPPEAPTATQIEESRARRLNGEALPAPAHGSEQLKAIVLKACAFSSADRYTDPTSMRRDLERVRAMLLTGIPFDPMFGGAAGATAYLGNEPTAGGAAAANHTVVLNTGGAGEHTVGIFDETTSAAAAVQAGGGTAGTEEPASAASGQDGAVPPPSPADGEEKSGRGKLFAVIGGVTVIIIVIILLLLRGCGGDADGGDMTTTTGNGDLDEPVATTTDGGEGTKPPVTTTVPTTDEPIPSTHEHGITSETWESDGLSHWYVCECGEVAEKADHTYGDWEVVKEATEMENGEKSRACTVCGFAETDTIPMKAHEHSYAAKWSENETSHWHACACGEKADIAAHSFSEWKVTKEATETETGTRERSCVICNHLEQGTVPVLSHKHSYTGNFVKNETSHWHACECGEKADVSAHVFGIWTVTKAATCTTAGSQTHACAVCGYTENQTIQPTGHTEAVDAAVAATCTTAGLTAGKHCSVCDTVLVKQNPIAATGVHTYTNGRCSGCGKGEVSTVTVGDETITVTYGQTYGALPTPTKVGYTFKGWYLNGVQIVAGSTVTAVGDHTLEDRWTANTYSITYVLNNGKKRSGGSYPASYTVEDTLSISDLNYSSYADYISFTGWYEDEELTKAFNPAQNNLKTNPRNLTLYADFEDFTVYTSIDSTPFNLHGLVILDWRNETNTDLLAHTNRAVEESRYHNIDIESDVPEVVFIGNASKTFTNFSMYLCGYASGQKLTVRFVNFNFTAGQEAPIDLYYSDGMDLTIDVVGTSSIGTAIAGGNVLDLDTASVTFTGAGDLTLTAGNGADAVKEGDDYDGSDGQDGGVAILATNVIVDMTGSLSATGGKGGNGEQGATGQKGDNGGRRDIIGGKAGNGEKGDVGGVGGNGGAGGYAVRADSLNVKRGSVVFTGGAGGDGGTGGTGGVGGNGGCSNSWGTYGGDAGDGGTGGQGGNGRYGTAGISCESLVVSDSASVSNVTGANGIAGSGGDGGDPGNPGYYDGAGWDSGTARKGEPGDPGEPGAEGSVV